MSKEESNNTGSSPLSYFQKKMINEKNVSDLIIKAGAGFFLGTVASLTLMKRRVYPAVCGTSFGCGIALGNCLKDINEPQSGQDAAQDETK